MTMTAAQRLSKPTAGIVAGPGTADRLIDVNAVAALLDVSDRTVWKWSYAGKLPAPLRIGRSVKWRASDISRFIELACDITAFNAERAGKAVATVR